MNAGLFAVVVVNCQSAGVQSRSAEVFRRIDWMPN